MRLGPGVPVATAVIKSPDAFVQLMRDPSPGNFAEAYVDSAIDLEGDLFATMDVANAVEEVRLSPTQKVRLFLSHVEALVPGHDAIVVGGDRGEAPRRGAWPEPGSTRSSSTPPCSRASRSARAG